MTADTANRGYTYPQSTDNTQIWTHIQQLAEDVDVDVEAIAVRTVEKPLCIVRKSTVTSVDNNGEVLTWDTEDTDLSGLHSTSSNTSRITPNVAGWYRISATIHWAANATGRRATAVSKNGSIAAYGQISPGSSVGTTSTVITRTLQANGTTDYFEVFAYQDSGGALNSADTTGTVFEVSFERS